MCGGDGKGGCEEGVGYGREMEVQLRNKSWSVNCTLNV